jgi:hypothetical protein
VDIYVDIFVDISVDIFVDIYVDISFVGARRCLSTTKPDLLPTMAQR